MEIESGEVEIVSVGAEIEFGDMEIVSGEVEIKSVRVEIEVDRVENHSGELNSSILKKVLWNFRLDILSNDN